LGNKLTIKLTVGRIAALRCEEGKSQIFLRSDNGLGVRATVGSKSFIFQARIHGKAARITIGDVKAWTIPQAENEARRLKVLVDSGIDPRQVKSDQLAKAQADEFARNQVSFKDNVTVQEAWSAYVAERSVATLNGKPEWGERHKEHIKLITQSGGGAFKYNNGVKREGALVPLLSKRLIDLDSDAVKAWLECEIPKAPTAATKTFSTLRAFMSWCAQHPTYSSVAKLDACKTDIVRRIVPASKNKPNDSLRRAQLKPWFTTVTKINSPIIPAYLQCLLLTGARRNELAALKWDDVDFKWGSMTIRDKVDGLRTIPLTPYVSHLISTLPRRNAYVFSSPTAASGRLENPNKQHNRALNNAALPPITIHGLRRSFATLSEWVEVPAGVVAQIMGHKPSAIAEKHYVQRELDLLALWHNRIEAWILNEAGISYKPTTTTIRAVA
jgi:integrase